MRQWIYASDGRRGVGRCGISSRFAIADSTAASITSAGRSGRKLWKASRSKIFGNSEYAGADIAISHRRSGHRDIISQNLVGHAKGL